MHDLMIVLVSSVLASNGLWAFVMARKVKRSDNTKLLMGMAMGRIVNLSRAYIQRGWITLEELDDINHYLYEPYSNLGGNGTVQRIMRIVNELPIKELREELDGTF